jgi:hypothetical protein
VQGFGSKGFEGMACCLGLLLFVFEVKNRSQAWVRHMLRHLECCRV